MSVYVRKHLRFQGTPQQYVGSNSVVYAHCGSSTISQPVRDILNNIYHDRWIGVAGAVAWSLCSPDLSSTDFYLWRPLNFLVYSTLIASDETL
jgi:hypothetical protein